MNIKSKMKTAGLCILSLLVVIFAIAAYRFWSLSGSYRQDLEYSYARSLGELTEYLTDMENALQKGAYVSTPTGQAAVAAKLREAGGGAKAAMEALPFSQDKSEKIERSISTLSDFGLYMGRKSAEGQKLSPEDYSAMDTLLQHVEKIRLEFQNIREQTGDGRLSVGDTGKMLASTLNLPEPPPFDDNLSDLAKELSSLPTMLYDGPFSDHIEKKEPEFLKGKEQIDELKAVERAAEFLGVEPSGLKITQDIGGPLSAYEVGGDGFVLRVTKKGGEISFYKKDMEVKEAKLSYEQARDKALLLLEKAGYGKMKESYYVINDNICTINFASTMNTTILYPDLIKVSIELNQGGMLEFSSTGYLMNHRERENLSPKLTKEQAAKGLSSRLSQKESSLALIPTPGGEERLCYEFLCESEEGKDLLIYINSSTGLEEQIYLVDKSDKGYLVL